MSDKQIPILCIGTTEQEKGSYVECVPNFAEAQFDKGNTHYAADQLTTLDFVFTEEAYKSVSFINRAHHKGIRDSVFKTLYGALQQKARDRGADYILIQGFKCSCDNSMYKASVAQCQFLLRIRFKHVGATVYS